MMHELREHVLLGPRRRSAVEESIAASEAAWVAGYYLRPHRANTAETTGLAAWYDPG
eukprot:COSAG04_NODE_10155_length_800_cov_1.253923_1_plen_56_part_10